MTERTCEVMLCDKCGSNKLQVSAWIYANTRLPVDCSPPNDAVYCEDCDHDVDFKTESQPVPARTVPARPREAALAAVTPQDLDELYAEHAGNQKLEAAIELARGMLTLYAGAEVKDNAGASRYVNFNLAHEIGRALRTQNNQGTSYPAFVVRQRVRTWCDTPDGATGSVWCDPSDDEVENPEHLRVLSTTRLDEYLIDGVRYRKAWYRDTYVPVTTCITHGGAEEFIADNAHNLTDPHVYVASGYRNSEWRRLRALLLFLAGTDFNAEV